MAIEETRIENLLKGYQKPEDMIGENGLLSQLTKQLLERALGAELTEHVGYDKYDSAGRNSVLMSGWQNTLSIDSYLVIPIKRLFGYLLYVTIVGEESA